MVAAVCTMTTIAMMRPSGTRRIHWLTATSGSMSFGNPTVMTPSTGTPRLSSPIEATATLAAINPINAPGIRALMFSETVMIASTPRPIANVYGLAWPRLAINDARRASIGPDGAGKPRIAGSCEIRIWAEMPTRKPVVTGTDNRSATQPRRQIPPTMRKSPTMNASATASAA